MSEQMLVGLRIREALVSDAASISSLVRALSQRYIALEFSARGRENLLGTMTPEAIAEKIASGYRYHVAEDAGHLVATVGMRDNRHLYHLFVAESHQGRGLARRLWDVALVASRAAGYAGAYTVNSSRYARGFYERLGFMVTSDTIEKDGVVFVPMTLEMGD
jgi:ribosomal protein S18 acetylase RimI-like enzyme